MSQQKEQETKQETSLIHQLLPAFMWKVAKNDGVLDLGDSIAASAYKGCGYYVISVNPRTGTIHEVCDGTEDGSPYMGGVTDRCEEVFAEFAWNALEFDGNIAIRCMFSQYTASDFELVFSDETYNYDSFLAFLDATARPSNKHVYTDYLKEVSITKVSFQTIIETLTGGTKWTEEELSELPRGKVIGLFTEHTGVTGNLEIT